MEDIEWNAFEKAKAEDVKQTEQLSSVCRDELLLYDQTVICRKVHRQGEREHEAMINDDTGRRTVRITWI